MMETMSPEEAEKRKRAVFDGMSPRSQQRIVKHGYDKWDPFQMPNDPIDMRKDKTRRTSQVLIRDFLQALESDSYSTEYARGAFELCLGIINKEDRFLGMFAFACWYKALLEKEGLDLFENK